MRPLLPAAPAAPEVVSTEPCRLSRRPRGSSHGAVAAVPRRVALVEEAPVELAGPTVTQSTEAMRVAELARELTTCLL